MPNMQGTPGNFAGGINFGDATSDDHQITGSVYISGSLYASEYVVDAVTRAVTKIEQQGSTKFGDTSDDKHQFSGSLSVSGSILPSDDSGHDLGSTTKRWANVYTGDLHLANERGNWTVIEEEDYLTIRNNKTGKRFKLLMQEIGE